MVQTNSAILQAPHCRPHRNHPAPWRQVSCAHAARAGQAAVDRNEGCRRGAFTRSMCEKNAKDGG